MIHIITSMTEISQINVKLKPIFNVQPRVYIPIIYIFIVISLFFIVTIFPGIKNNGSLVTINSHPQGASIYIDNKNVGSTPLDIFIDKGNYNLSIKKSNFNTYNKGLSINGKIFLSLFKKNKDLININLELLNASNILKQSYITMSKWSLLNKNDINKRYQIPFLISDSIMDFHSSKNIDKNELDLFLKSSIKLVTNEFILSDYLRGLMIAKSDNRLPSISSVINSTIFVADIIKEYPDVPLLLYNKIITDNSLLLDSKYYSYLKDKHILKINKNLTKFDEKKDDVYINKIRFKYIPKSELTPNDINFIHSIKEEAFYISEYMITKESYYNFVNDNPKWSKENIKNLKNDGLVDNYYLDFSNDEDYITNISYYSALAWCEWANKTFDLPTGFKISLPSENMWFSSVMYGSIKNIDAWQWTNQGFYIYDHFLTNNMGIPISEYEIIQPRLVVGKNKYNTKIESGRGVQDANWCTPFLSFRPVLVKEK